jgi:hypothetical protein
MLSVVTAAEECAVGTVGERFLSIGNVAGGLVSHGDNTVCGSSRICSRQCVEVETRTTP